MASQWFYKIYGEKVGPVSSQQLRQLADEGRIHMRTLVWREGIADWVEAQRVKGLFSAAGDSSVALSGILQRSAPAHATDHGPPPLPKNKDEAGRTEPTTSTSQAGATPKRTPSQWFYKRNDEKLGPVSSQQLRALADDGRIEPTTPVWREGIGDWVEAKQVKGLFTDALDNHAAALSGIGHRMPAATTKSIEEPQTESNDLTQAGAARKEKVTATKEGKEKEGKGGKEKVGRKR